MKPGGSAECGEESLAHVLDVEEGVLASEGEVKERKNDEAMSGQTSQHRHDVPPQQLEVALWIVHRYDSVSQDGRDPDRRQPACHTR